MRLVPASTLARLVAIGCVAAVATLVWATSLVVHDRAYEHDIDAARDSAVLVPAGQASYDDRARALQAEGFDPAVLRVRTYSLTIRTLRSDATATARAEAGVDPPRRWRSFHAAHAASARALVEAFDADLRLASLATTALGAHPDAARLADIEASSSWRQATRARDAARRRHEAAVRRERHARPFAASWFPTSGELGDPYPTFPEQGFQLPSAAR
ncbi:MAG: hypothetical protein JWM98_151 [Thermoleophilia bacterium]|nr:hypothetical protein [Thermoleophilia bacterium]